MAEPHPKRNLRNNIKRPSGFGGQVYEFSPLGDNRNEQLQEDLSNTPRPIPAMAPKKSAAQNKRKNPPSGSSSQAEPLALFNKKWSKALLNPDGSSRVPPPAPQQQQQQTPADPTPTAAPTPSTATKPPKRGRPRKRSLAKDAIPTPDQPTPAPPPQALSPRSQARALTNEQLLALPPEQFTELMVEDDELAHRMAETLRDPVNPKMYIEHLGVRYNGAEPLHDLGPILFLRQIEELRRERRRLTGEEEDEEFDDDWDGDWGLDSDDDDDDDVGSGGQREEGADEGDKE